MRINSEERRRLNRRLRNRIPAALQAGMGNLPKFALLISATFYMTPEALAQVEKHQAEAHLTMEKAAEGTPSVYEKTYTEAELNKTMPKRPVQTMDERILDEINALLSRLRSNQRGSTQRDKAAAFASVRATEERDDLSRLRQNPRYFQHREDHILREWFEDENFKAQHMMKLATLKEEPKYEKHNSGDKIRQYFAGEMQKAITDRTKNKLGFWGKLTSGLDLNFDLGGFFSGSDSAGKKTSETQPSGHIRYGLVLKDIDPDRDAPKRAGIGDNLSDLKYAGHAEVEWTIGPIDTRDRMDLVKVRPLTETSASKDESLFDSFEMPSTKFRLRGRPDFSLDNITKVEGKMKKLPNISWSLQQEDGYYTLSYKTEADGTKISEVHTIKIPVVGNAKFGRRFNDKWEAVQTSFYDILIDKRAPLVSVHYMHFSDQYKGSLKYNLDSSSSISMSAKTEAGNPAKVEADNSTERAERARREYNLSYNKKF